MLNSVVSASFLTSAFKRPVASLSLVTVIVTLAFIGTYCEPVPEPRTSSTVYSCSPTCAFVNVKSLKATTPLALLVLV